MLKLISHRGNINGKQPVKNSIAVMPEWHDDVSLCKGICSDNII
jgi:hypothetical protein